MNDIVDKIYVINMKKDTKRLSVFKKQVANYFSYSLVEGVDATNNIKYKNKYEKWLLDNNYHIDYDTFNWQYYINRYSDLKQSNVNTKDKAWEHWEKHGKHELRSCNPDNDIVNKGQWGCLHSHINILKHAIKNNYNSILILEDDIILTKEFNHKIQKLKDFLTIHDNWDLIYLGASQHNWDNITFNEDYYHAHNSTGTFAYIVHNRFYKILLDEFTKMKKPVDNYLVDMQQIYKPNIYVLYPNIIICNLEESNIGKQRNNTEYFKKFRWNI